jgi:hypothetical protein
MKEKPGSVDDAREVFYLAPGDTMEMIIRSPYQLSGADSLFDAPNMIVFAAAGTDRLLITAEKGPNKAARRKKERLRRVALKRQLGHPAPG